LAEYVYDFGDSWDHKIQLEKILPGEKGATYPVCIKGKRAYPLEDCGGLWGYANISEALEDPDNEEAEELLDWVGEDFDPEHFDTAEVRFSDLGKRFKFAFGFNSDLQLKSGGWGNNVCIESAAPHQNPRLQLKSRGCPPTTNTRTQNDPDDHVTSQHLTGKHTPLGQTYKTSIIRQPYYTTTYATHHPQDRRQRPHREDRHPDTETIRNREVRRRDRVVPPVSRQPADPDSRRRFVRASAGKKARFTRWIHQFRDNRDPPIRNIAKRTCYHCTNKK